MKRLLFALPLLFVFSGSSMAETYKKPGLDTPHGTIVEGLKLLRDGKFDNWIEKHCSKDKKCFNAQANSALNNEVAKDIMQHQMGRFFGREPTVDEYSAAESAVAECAPKPCTAEAFARPLCFALLSGAEMLFY